MKRIEIRHTTRYSFGAPVKLGPHTLLVRPREGHDLRIASSALDISPEPVLTWRRDLYDNVLGVATFGEEPADQLGIESRVEVELYDIMPLDFFVDAHAVHFPFQYKSDEHMALAPYLKPAYRRDARLSKWLKAFRKTPKGTETFTVLDRMNGQIHDELGYEVREEEGVLSPTETLHRGKGSCRDLAALFLESCRRLGIAARFVSGYVHGPATEAGGAATHAWAEVYLPGAGWKGFDPTNATVVGPDHITVAVHHHPEAVPPIAGVFTGPAGLSPMLSVDVQINQLAIVESPL
jgi:transglutaminase-like putative cysteine protease